MNEEQNIIIYNTQDGKSAVSLYAKDGSVWMNQNQLAELFDTSIPNITMHISNILKEKELEVNSVIKDYLTTESACFNRCTISISSLRSITSLFARFASPTKNSTDCSDNSARASPVIELVSD